MGLTAELKRSIRSSGMPLYLIARGAGLSHPTVLRFLAGRDIRLRSAEKLFRYFNFEIKTTPTKKKKRAAGRK